MRQLNLPSTKDLFENATTALQVAEISNHLENIQAYEKVVIAEQARRNAIMEEGAKANIEQKELLLLTNITAYQ